MKHFLPILLLLSFDLNGQTVNRDSLALDTFTFRCVEDVESLYEPKADADTTFILTALWSLRAFEEIFLLTRREGIWTTRYFSMDYKRAKCFTETKVQSKDVESIWQSIKSENLLSIPDDVRDSTGKVIDLNILHGIYYDFKIFTRARLREYIYQSPQAYVEDFPNEIVFRNVVSIIEKIYTSYGIKYPYKKSAHNKAIAAIGADD